MKLYQLQTNCSSGELDPLMAGRFETPAYKNGLKSATNIALLATGGGVRRPSLAYKATLTGKARLLEFDYDADNRFVLAVYGATTAIFDDTGTLVQTLNPTPWTIAQAFELTYAQLGDIVVVCHKDVTTQLIYRNSDTGVWSIENFEFEPQINSTKTFQPFDKFADFDTTLTASAASGSVTLTTSAAFFVPGHVGCRLRMFDTEILITAYTSSTVATGLVYGTIEGTLGVNPFLTINGSSNVEVTHVAHGLATGQIVTFSSANTILTSSGGASVLVNGAKVVTVLDNDRYVVSGSASATGAVDGGGPNVKYTIPGIPTRSWSEQVFSSVRGWPRACVFHEQRLWLAGPQSRPNYLYSSWINRFFNFSVTDGLDNESIQVSIGADSGAAIRHMVSNRHLQIFTESQEYYCPRQSSQQTLTPSNFTSPPQTPYGIASVRPIAFDGATLFLQKNGVTVREFMYSDTDLSYNSSSISILATHLIKTPVDVARLQGTSQRGEQYATFVNSDGTLSVFHSARSEKLAGWTPWQCEREAHYFRSVAALGSTLFFCVERDAAFYLESLEADDTAHCLDSYTTYSGASATAWTLDTRYRNKTVWVNAGDFSLGSFAVPGSGIINLDVAQTSIEVGYEYFPVVETLPPSLTLPTGESAGNKSRIASALIWFNETISASVNGTPMLLRTPADAVEAAVSRYTGVKRFFFRGYSRAPTVTVTQDEPLPFRLLSLKTKVIA